MGHAKASGARNLDVGCTVHFPGVAGARADCNGAAALLPIRGRGPATSQQRSKTSHEPLLRVAVKPGGTLTGTCGSRGSST
jgi:hypothetical protein